MMGERRHVASAHNGWAFFWLVAASIIQHPSSSIAEAAQVEQINGLRVVHLSGTPRELGRQHGELLRDEVRSCVSDVLRYFRSYLKVPWVRSWLVNWWLDSAWKRATPFVPARYLEELQGVAEGSGVPLRELVRLHAVPDRTYSCATFAAWGQATHDGRLIHMRNLDWNIKAGVQRYPVVFVMRPDGQRAFVSIAWAGFIGALTGVNDAQISIGQVGADTVDASFRGEPMVFLMRRVLEEATDLDVAAQLITRAHRTVGVNYLIADASAHRALAIETTHRQVRVFVANDPAEHAVAYARPLRDVVFRADTAMDPAIRALQRASGGDPTQPGAEAPKGSAYTTRYLGQAAGLSSHVGQLDAESAQAIARAVAPDSNVHSVVMAWPDIWVANADGLTPAAHTTYRRLNASQLLQRLD